MRWHRWLGTAGLTRRASPLSSDAAPFQPIRRERLIAGCRVALSTFSLLAVWLDPSEPAHSALLAYTLLAAYTVYSIVLAFWLWSAKATPAVLPLVVHVIDLVFFCVVVFFTAGPNSPFFIFFVYAVAAATVRWQEEGTFWTAVATLGSYLVIGIIAASRFPDEGFELNRFILRSIYLTAVAVLLGYLGAFENRLRARVAALGDLPAGLPPEAAGLLRALLEHAAKALGAPRILLVWEEREEPWSNLALWSAQGFDWQHEAPDIFSPLAPDELTTTAFFVAQLPAGGGLPRLVTSSGVKPWPGDPVPAALRARFDLGAVLSVPFQGESLSGRLFALDRPDMTSDELVLGEILARQLAVRMDQLALFERLHEAGLAHERVRLARDLHDGVIQSLSGAALRLESARQLLDRAPAQAGALIAEIQELLLSEQRELREFIADLEPGGARSQVRPAGLEERLERLGERIHRHWDLSVEVRSELGAARISDELAYQIYRIVQEGLVNASRHGRASRATVELGIEANWVRVVVADDGRGFAFQGTHDFATLTAGKLGPVSLKQRIGALGGCLDIKLPRGEQG